MGEIEDMKSERSQESEKFAQAKEDDEKAIELLEQAKAKLSEYYASNPKPAALLERHFDEPAPHAKFSGKDKRKNESKGIISILQLIIDDLKQEVKDGVKTEE